MIKNSMVPTSTNKRMNRVTSISKTNAKVGIQGNYSATLNGSVFSLKEAFSVVKEGRFKPENFCDIVVNPKTHKKCA